MFENPGDRRVRARGLQDLAVKPDLCRPGALTGRVFKHALSEVILPEAVRDEVLAGGEGSPDCAEIQTLP